MASVSVGALLAFCLYLLVTKNAAGENASQVLSGENLRCLECQETFKANYTFDTSCQRRLSEVDRRYCGASGKYCQTKRIERFGQTISIERGCTSKCLYGCRADKFGLTTLTCISCCRNLDCNTDNGSEAAVTSYSLLISALLLLEATLRL